MRCNPGGSVAVAIVASRPPSLSATERRVRRVAEGVKRPEPRVVSMTQGVTIRPAVCSDAHGISKVLYESRAGWSRDAGRLESRPALTFRFTPPLLILTLDGS
jgi:hypothetical protein